jgi:hypothetical protein
MVPLAKLEAVLQQVLSVQAGLQQAAPVALS